MICRPATKDDLRQFYGISPGPTTKAWIFDRDDELLGAVGFTLRDDGRWWAFADLSHEARRHKVTIVRASKRVMKDMNELGVRNIYVDPDPDEDNAVKWLASLGFKPHGGRIMKWSAAQ